MLTSALTLGIAGVSLPLTMADKDPCLIGNKTTVRGQISGKQDLVVEGRIEGRVGIDSKLVVEDAGVVEADVEAIEAAIHGELRGELSATKAAFVFAGARVAGSIRAPRVVIEDGAHFQGTIEMDVELPPGVSAGE